MIWQFKNGSIASMRLVDLVQMDARRYYTAWDRSLGGYVFYERS